MGCAASAGVDEVVVRGPTRRGTSLSSSSTPSSGPSARREHSMEVSDASSDPPPEQAAAHPSQPLAPPPALRGVPASSEDVFELSLPVVGDVGPTDPLEASYEAGRRVGGPQPAVPSSAPLRRGRLPPLQGPATPSPRALAPRPFQFVSMVDQAAGRSTSSDDPSSPHRVLSPARPASSGMPLRPAMAAAAALSTPPMRPQLLGRGISPVSPSLASFSSGSVTSPPEPPVAGGHGPSPVLLHPSAAHFSIVSPRLFTPSTHPHGVRGAQYVRTSPLLQMEPGLLSSPERSLRQGPNPFASASRRSQASSDAVELGSSGPRSPTGSMSVSQRRVVRILSDVGEMPHETSISIGPHDMDPDEREHTGVISPCSGQESPSASPPPRAALMSLDPTALIHHDGHSYGPSAPPSGQSSPVRSSALPPPILVHSGVYGPDGGSIVPQSPPSRLPPGTSTTGMPPSSANASSNTLSLSSLGSIRDVVDGLLREVPLPTGQPPEGLLTLQSRARHDARRQGPFLPPRPQTIAPSSAHSDGHNGHNGGAAPSQDASSAIIMGGGGANHSPASPRVLPFPQIAALEDDQEHDHHDDTAAGSWSPAARPSPRRPPPAQRPSASGCSRSTTSAGSGSQWPRPAGAVAAGGSSSGSSGGSAPALNGSTSTAIHAADAPTLRALPAECDGPDECDSGRCSPSALTAINSTPHTATPW